MAIKRKKQRKSVTAKSAPQQDAPNGLVPSRLPGLRNLGNTCWLNSVMQCLTHCHPLVSSIARSDHRKECLATDSVLSAVEEHIQSACTSTEPFMSPDKIVDILPLLSSTLLRGRQEDAHEFLRNLVSGMQNSMVEQHRRRGKSKGTDSDDESHNSDFSTRKRAIHSNKFSSSKRKSSRLRSTREEEDEVEDVTTDSDKSSETGEDDDATAQVQQSYPFSLFKGSILNEIRCTKCQSLSSKEDPIEDLELEISRSSSLGNALTEFCTEEELSGENAYHCEKCKGKVTAKKAILLHRVPRVLTVSLKRFAVSSPYQSMGRSSSRVASKQEKAEAGAEAEAEVEGVPKAGFWGGLFGAARTTGGTRQEGGDNTSKFDTSRGDGGVPGMVIRQRRGRSGPQKVQHYVHYPEYLDLTGFCTPSSSSSCTSSRSKGAAGKAMERERNKREGLGLGVSGRYMRLFAVVVHLGSTISAGHYISYVRSMSSQCQGQGQGQGGKGGGSSPAPAGGVTWHRMDDSHATVVSTEEALSQCAYILFYERCGDKEARDWQRRVGEGEPGGRDLADINIQYSELMLASQGTEKEKKKGVRGKREEEEADDDDEDEEVEGDLQSRRMVRRKVSRESSPGGIIGLVSSILSPFKPPSPPLTRSKVTTNAIESRSRGKAKVRVNVGSKPGADRGSTSRRSDVLNSPSGIISAPLSSKSRSGKVQRQSSPKGRTSRRSDSVVDSMVSPSSREEAASREAKPRVTRSSCEELEQAEAESGSRGVMHSVTKFVTDFLFENDD